MARVKKPIKEIWGTEKQPEGQVISKKECKDGSTHVVSFRPKLNKKRKKNKK